MFRARGTQPVAPVRVDWGNPITRGLLVAAVPSILRELVTGKALTPVSSPIVQETPSGRAGRSDGAASYYGCDIPTVTLTSAFTIMWLGRASGTPGLDTRSFCVASSASNNPLAMINVSASTATKMRTFWRDDAGNFPASLPDSNAVAFQTGRPKMLALRVPDMGAANTGAATLFIDGVQDVTSAQYTSTTLTVNRVGVGCLYRAAAGSFFAGDSVVGFFWNRALTDTEIQAVTRNPWALFEPARRKRRGFAASAGGASGTSATTNANDTSSASGTTTVTGTSAKTNANDTSSAAGTTTVMGASATTNADDTSSASGSVGSAVSGSSATTNANDAGAATGTTTVTGTSARTNANDAAAAAGTTTVLGTLARTNANDTASASGVAGAVTGTAAATNADDTSAASGSGGTARPAQGAGKPSRNRRPRVVEIDGEDFVVNSEEEAIALLDQARDQAKQLAATAVKRAAAAERRPTRKVIQDARRLLVAPEITASDDLQPLVQQAQDDIAATYASALASVEIAALLARRQREEEDDEDVLLLIA